MASGTITKPADDVLSLGTLIPNNADLNDYTENGRFYCPSITGVANTPSGFSSGVSFDLIVMRRASAIRAWQIMFAYANLPQLWIRAQNGATTFTDWINIG